MQPHIMKYYTHYQQPHHLTIQLNYLPHACMSGKVTHSLGLHTHKPKNTNGFPQLAWLIRGIMDDGERGTLLHCIFPMPSARSSGPGSSAPVFLLGVGLMHVLDTNPFVRWAWSDLSLSLPLSWAVHTLATWLVCVIDGELDRSKFDCRLPLSRVIIIIYSDLLLLISCERVKSSLHCKQSHPT